ncbi:hypothetical protein PQX77_017684 [Marasmius sp. AFHP31]|nr:hypothetical protein PQX77_017684 [Marasmius sp. AFHP31]
MSRSRLSRLEIEDLSSSLLGGRHTDGTLRVGNESSLRNVLNVVVGAIGMVIVLGPLYPVGRRKAIVGRIEFRFLLLTYLLPLQLLAGVSLLGHHGLYHAIPPPHNPPSSAELTSAWASHPPSETHQATRLIYDA